MEIKFKNKLENYDYIIGIDLANYKTGLCVYSIKQNRFVDFIEIEVSKQSEDKIFELYNKLDKFFVDLATKNPGKYFIVKEACPSQNGPFSTISTLQSLAQAHAVLDIVAHLHDVPFYDYRGVHSITVKAFFRTKENSKPQKEDIRKEIVSAYNLDNTKLTDNISDSMGVVHVFIHKKWNADIDQEIKNIKKEIKALKKEEAVNIRKDKIQALEDIKRRE